MPDLKEGQSLPSLSLLDVQQERTDQIKVPLADSKTYGLKQYEEVSLTQRRRKVGEGGGGGEEEDKGVLDPGPPRWRRGLGVDSACANDRRRHP